MSEDQVKLAHAEAVRCVGRDAKPSGELKMLTDSHGAGRIQMKWVGALGHCWLDIPIEKVLVLPPRNF